MLRKNSLTEQFPTIRAEQSLEPDYLYLLQLEFAHFLLQETCHTWLLTTKSTVAFEMPPVLLISSRNPANHLLYASIYIYIYFIHILNKQKQQCKWQDIVVPIFSYTYFCTWFPPPHLFKKRKRITRDAVQLKTAILEDSMRWADPVQI